MTTKHEDKDKDTKDEYVDEPTATPSDVDPVVDAQLATGVAPAWATDPTTNKNTAQRFV